ncbi:hypothetical protein, partial [Thiolapillus sp.]|uniref:hypothetical protein n=1 Tax=Thiolapillus sp. TaxID=2017437 RepID=UPI003AF5B195
MLGCGAGHHFEAQIKMHQQGFQLIIGFAVTFEYGFATLDKRVFGLVIDFGTSQSPKSTRPLTTYWCPSRPGHPALRN